jgi:hypothetical protein
MWVFMPTMARAEPQEPTYLLAAGSIVSVEARHTAGVRALLGRPTTEPDSDRAVSDDDLGSALNPVKGRAYDELYTPKQIVAIVSSLKVLNNRSMAHSSPNIRSDFKMKTVLKVAAQMAVGVNRFRDTIRRMAASWGRMLMPLLLGR